MLKRPSLSSCHTWSALLPLRVIIMSLEMGGRHPEHASTDLPNNSYSQSLFRLYFFPRYCPTLTNLYSISMSESTSLVLLV